MRYSKTVQIRDASQYGSKATAAASAGNPPSGIAPMPSARHLALFVLALTLPATHPAAAHNDGYEWPEGSAMHSIQLESERLDAGLAALDEAHASLMDAMTGNEA